MNYESRNPFNSTLYGSYPIDSDTTLETLLQQGAKEARTWSLLPFSERQILIQKLGHLILEELEGLAHIISEEMGKPLEEAKAELCKSADTLLYFAQYAGSWLQSKRIEEEGFSAEVQYKALGLILAVMPWNFPFWQVLRFAGPALLAGNTVLLKHAPNVPRCALALVDLFRRAGFPSAVFQNCFASEEQIARALADERVQGLTLTGSVRAGSALGALAGKHIKKMVLELGGSDAWVILDDADLEQAVEQGLRARLSNNGQTCIAAKRFIIDQSLETAFLKLLKEGLKEYQCGNPLEGKTKLSCLARPDLADALEEQVERGIAAGASLLFPGGREGQSLRFAPIVLGDISPENPIYREELFGPVFSVYFVRSEEQALRLANDSPFGLGASVWSQNTERALKFARKLEVGAVAINQILSSDARLPFGGVKQSGIGRELGKEGLFEFVNVQAIRIS